VAVYTRTSLEKCLENKQRLEIKVVGGVYVADDIPPNLALSTIHNLEVHGVLRASQAVKDAFADRVL
jgi:hypothetical protein